MAHRAGCETDLLDPDERERLRIELGLFAPAPARSSKRATSKPEQQQQQKGKSKLSKGKKKQTKQREEENAADAVDVVDGDEDPCLVCWKDCDHAKLLICDKCDGHFHTYCLPDPLESIPEDDWFCGAYNILYTAICETILQCD